MFIQSRSEGMFLGGLQTKKSHLPSSTGTHRREAILSIRRTFILPGRLAIQAESRKAFLENG